MKLTYQKLIKSMRPLVLMLATVAFVSGCGGGGAVRPDSGSGGGNGATTGAILGAIVIGGAIWAGKELASSAEADQNKTSASPILFLVPVTNSVYDNITYIGNEPKDFGVYSYILFGKYPTQGQDAPLYRRYNLLLNLIQEKPYWPEFEKPSPPNETDQKKVTHIDTNNMNVYLLPSNEAHAQRIVSIEDYNFDLSMKILWLTLGEKVTPKFKDKFLSEGPFLISMPYPIQNRGKQYMLFADFTNISEDMFQEIFNSYEKALKSGSNSTKDPFGLLENIRIELGQKLVEVNNVFHVIGEASTGK